MAHILDTVSVLASSCSTSDDDNDDDDDDNNDDDENDDDDDDEDGWLASPSARMLRSKDTPDGCSPRMYQSVALSVLSCFVTDEVNKYSRRNYRNRADVTREIQQMNIQK